MSKLSVSELLSAAHNYNNSNSSVNTFSDDDPVNSLVGNLNPSQQAQMQPYMSYNYQNGIWDNIGDFVGFRTRQDAYREQAQQLARQQLVSLANDQWQFDRNTAQEQASRERDAGINPDLAGEVSGEAAPEPEQPLSPFGENFLQPPTDIFPDLFSTIGNIASSVSSVGQFAQALTSIKNVKANTQLVGEQTANVAEQRKGFILDNMQKAYDYIGNWLRSKDPRIWAKTVDPSLDLKDPHVLKEAVKKSMLDEVQTFGVDLGGYLSKAFDVRSTDPHLLNDWFNVVKQVPHNRLEAQAAEQTLGVYNMVQDAVGFQSGAILDFKIAELKDKYEWDAAVAAYNKLAAENSGDYEEWKRQFHVPMETANEDLLKALSGIMESNRKMRENDLRKRWLEWLWARYKEGNNAFILNGWLNPAGYTPLQNMGGSVAGLGIHGQSQINPAFGPSGKPVVPSNPAQTDSLKQLYLQYLNDNNKLSY